jgi:rubredoxin
LFFYFQPKLNLVHCLNPVFRCLNNTCSQVFDKPVDYILHARIHNQKQLTNHHHRKHTTRCRLCKKLFLTIEQLELHLITEKHQFLCPLCSATFESNNSYHNHIAQHPEMLPVYRCTKCIESFGKRSDLSEHVIAKHKKDLPKQKICPTCKLTFKTTFHLNRHNRSKHSDIKPFKCEHDGCEQAFAR